MSKVQIGDRARDIVSGLEGIVTQRTVAVTGSVRLVLEPQSKDKSALNEAYGFDDQIIELVEEGVVKSVPLPDEMTDINLGDRVKDKITGFTGIATIRREYLNGCVFFVVEAEKTGQEIKEDLNMPWQRLEVVKKSAFKLPEVATAPKVKSNGGPGERIGRRAEARM